MTIHFPKDDGKELRTENVCEQDFNLQLCRCAFINKLAYTALRSAQQTHWPIHVIVTAQLDTLVRLMEIRNATWQIFADM